MYLDKCDLDVGIQEIRDFHAQTGGAVDGEIDWHDVVHSWWDMYRAGYGPLHPLMASSVSAIIRHKGIAD